MRRRNRRYSLAAGVVVALVGLTACSGGPFGDSKSSDSGAAGDGMVASEPADSAGGLRDSSSNEAPRTVVRTRSLVKTGEISLTNKNLAKVRGQVDDLLAALGGSVDKEDTTNDKDGRVDRSTLTLRIPVDKFHTAKDALERLGKLKSSTESQKDVTTEVIDTAERVQTLQNSLDRLQRFQRSAEDVDDLIRFENQITTRQAELQSLKAQQTYLSDQTSMSTITLHLSTPDKYVAPPGALDDAGFLTGLKSGWNALVGFVIVVLTVLGAVLPFLAAGALLGVPAWFAVRALLRRRRTQAEAMPLPDSP